MRFACYPVRDLGVPPGSLDEDDDDADKMSDGREDAPAAWATGSLTLESMDGSLGEEDNDGGDDQNPLMSTDSAVTLSGNALALYVEDLARRLESGESVYVHCWGGRGRAGTVGACLLGRAWGVATADEALERVQRAFDTRGDREGGIRRLSPETPAQIKAVRRYFKTVLGRS